MYYVYILKLNNNTIYVGSTPDIKRRVNDHKNGYSLSTKNSRPIRLIWFGCFSDRLTARRFENYLKQGSGRAFLKRRLISIDSSK